MSALWILLGLVVGAGAAAIFYRARVAAARSATARVTDELAATLAGRDAERERAHALDCEVVDLRGNLRGEVARLEAALEHERALAAEKVAAIEQANERLRESFKALSGDALLANSTQFLELAKAAFAELQAHARGDLDVREQKIDQLVEQIGNSLTQVNTKVELLERDRKAAQGALEEHLRSVVEGQQQLRVETGALVAALRQPHTRGRWAELQLKRVVEMTGMLPHCDFDQQRTVRGDDGALRPDLVVHIPGGKNIVVDAKAPLQAFLEAHNAPDAEQAKLHMRAHARQLREHIGKLSAKAYWQQFDDAPDFVLMFLPGEHFFNGALEVEPTLLEEAANQCVLIATPMTLIALLRAVAYGWQQEKIAENARAISELGKELHGRLAVLADRMQKVSRRLGSTVDAFNEAVGSLEGRVLVTARRFQDHGAVSAAKELPVVEPVDTTPRTLRVPELERVDEVLALTPPSEN
jgi:DNA recombination protein RmuC